MGDRLVGPAGGSGRVATRPWAVGLGFLGLLAVAQAWLWAHGVPGVPVSADGDDVRPVWWRWAPVAVGVIVLLIAGGRRPAPQAPELGRASRARVLALVALAVTFTIALAVAGGAEVVHTGGKIVLLVIVPLVVLSGVPRPDGAGGSGPGVVAAVSAWTATYAVLEWDSWRAAPAPVSTVTGLAAVLLIGFLVNAVIEELFYRRWLQTHVEARVGPWPAIVLSTVLWSSWHMGIQGVGRADLDLAAVLLSHAATGVFLGLLWSRHRRMWPLLAVHGALNAAPVLVAFVAPST